MASLGEGKDPDEFIKMHSEDGAERLAEAFKAAISDTEYRLPNVQKRVGHERE